MSPSPFQSETILFLVAITIALVPIVATYWRRRRPVVVASASLWFVCAGVIVWYSFHSSPTRPTAANVVETSIRPVEVPENGYVSSDACRACHPTQYDSWHRSYHRTMTQEANSDTVVGDFDNVHVHGYGRHHRLFKEDGQHYAMTDLGTRNERKRRVVMTTGSHAMQYVWVESEKKNHAELIQSSFLFEDNRWVPRESVFLAPRQSSIRNYVREFWGANCIRCHSTAPHPGYRTGTKVAEFGIACEACHGPGENHVAANQDPLRRYQFHLTDDIDDTIVEPSQLSPRLSSQICGFCHSHAFHSDVKYQPGHFISAPFPDRGHSYRPGDELTETVEIDSHEKYVERGPQMQGRFWPDGMVRGSGREYSDLVQSPCFQGGHESHQMGCLSCHTMHHHSDNSQSLDEWANDQLKEGMNGDQGCLQCHSMDSIPEHTHHGAESAGSRCYNCHMPHTTYGVMKAIRAHQNTNPSVQTTLDTGRPNACNLCHLDKSLEWTGEHLTKWYDHPVPELTEEQKSTSSAALFGLRGSADQRVLIAWHMGWQPATETSKNSWLAPYLGQLLNDPYDAIRYVAYRSLRRIPAFANFKYDWLGPEQDRAAAPAQVLELWNKSRQETDVQENSDILIGPDGQIDEDRYNQILQQRDDRPISVEE